MQIHRRIQGGSFPNSTQLAEEIEVTTRTIKRDIDFMKSRLNLPIQYDAQRYGYHYSKPVEHFPSMPMTEVEVFALLIADKAVAQYQGTPWQQPLDSAFRRLMSQLDQQTSYNLGSLDSAFSFRPLAPEQANLVMFQKLTQALKERRVVTFQYRKLGANTPQQRTTQPYHVACVDSHWYLFAFDEDRQAIRTFALSRIGNLALTRRRFEKSPTFNLDDYLKGSFAVYKGERDLEVVVEFDAWATDLLRGRRWHSNQELTELPNGGSRLQLRLNSIKEIERFILSFGTHATVLEPKELVTSMGLVAKELASRYR